MISPIEQQRNLVIEGWRVGFNKVGFTNLLQQELNLSLSVAKGMTDQILEGKSVAISVANEDRKRVASLAQGLGAIVRAASAVEGQCQ
ncbi:MAG TPA: hypothetical protein VHS13_07970 [Edaphobacter sp.]|jgi:hypothetical protein|nr:hypothetical protein [Edaphobacter sp.]